MKPDNYDQRTQKLISSNKRATFEYAVLSKLEAGVMLSGTEVKSLRSGKCSLQDAYCAFKNKDSYELWLYNVHIAEYDHGNRENHKPKRERKLLINYRESLKFKTAVKEKGMTIIPLQMYFSGHIVKVEIAIVKPKKNYDKRESTKEREVKRELDRKYKF